MDLETPVSSLSTPQLVTYLSKLGNNDISPAGLDSVWEKEVTGAMLCEFCEEDIKDVFAEFKDRFRIRKLLRDLSDKPVSRSAPAGQTPQPISQPADKLEPSSHECSSPKLRISSKVEEASSALLHLSSSSSSSESSFSSGASSVRNSVSSSAKQFFTKPCFEVIDLEEVDVKDEHESSSYAKRQRVEEALSMPHIPAAHSHSHSSYSLLQSTSGSGAMQRSSAANFVPPPPPPPPISVFLNKPEFHPAFGNAHTLRAAAVSNYTYSSEERSSSFSGSSFSGANSCGEDQALCLKKSPQRVPSAAHMRNDTSSPTTHQPSSTTPDYLGSLETRHLDLASVLSMGQLATKYSAHQILSKKSQRSRPNGAQKLGSILIRNAAQQANLWSDPPHLRSISQPQRQEFLNSVYRVAPHIREYEHLLWQRLSETLQNRRKYLLDKKLGKRGFSSTSSSSSSSGQASSSSSHHHDFGDFSEWQVSSMQNHFISAIGDDSHEDANVLNEVVAAAHGYNEERPIKKEPVQLE